MGYILLLTMHIIWYSIKNVRGVTGFISAGSNKPVPLTADEIYSLGVEEREIVVGYDVGDTVTVIDGPLSGFNGEVEMLDIEKNKVRVTGSMFGRETPVELELDQVEVVSE